MRTRSLLRTATCALDVLHLEPGAVAHGERDGGDDGHQQQHRRELERIGVLGVEHAAELARVAVVGGSGVAPLVTSTPDAAARPDHADDLDDHHAAP